MMPRLVIVGAGAVGWLAAVACARVHRDVIHVTLVDAPDQDAIGGLEATRPAFGALLARLALDEPGMLRAARATFRHGSRFVGWRARHPEGADYDHLFEPPMIMAGTDLGSVWAAHRELSPHARYAYATGVQATLCDAARAPRIASARPFEAPVAYGYHLDAGRLARWLREAAIAAGVRHVDQVAVGGRCDASGRLASVQTAAGTCVEGDLFIDATGRRALLIGGTLAQPLTPHTHAFICDQVLVGMAPLDEEGPLAPYTSVQPATAGWAWHAPLADRHATVLAWSSAFADVTAAQHALQRLLGTGAREAIVQRFDIAAGRRRAHWVGNCLALGAAGGTPVPLEVGALDLAVSGIAWLLDQPLADVISGACAARFDAAMAAAHDEALGIVGLHHALATRDDSPYWRAQGDASLPDAWRTRLERWRRRFPDVHQESAAARLLAPHAWQSVLAGHGPTGMAHNEAIRIDRDLARAAFVHVERERARALQVSPDHGEVIRALRSNDDLCEAQV